MEEGIQNPEDRGEQRRAWKWRLKLRLACVSAILCGLMICLWIYGIRGFGFHVVHLPLTEIVGGGGGIVVLHDEMQDSYWNYNRFLFVRWSAFQFGDNHLFPDEWLKRKFVLLTFDMPPDNPYYSPNSQSAVLIPYWLLILIFALPPILFERNRYIERRDKKLFAEAVASKPGRVGVPADHSATENKKDAVDGVPPH